MKESNALDFAAEIRVSATPEQLWAALVTPELVNRYHLAPLLKMELHPGGEVLYSNAAEIMISGNVTEVVTNSLLAHTFRFGPQKSAGPEGDADTLVTYEISPGENTVLRLRHSGFTEKNQTHANISSGWPFILKSLESFFSGTISPEEAEELS